MDNLRLDMMFFHNHEKFEMFNKSFSFSGMLNIKKDRFTRDELKEALKKFKAVRNDEKVNIPS